MRYVLLTLLLATIGLFAACEDEELLADLEKERDELNEEIVRLEEELDETDRKLAELRSFPEIQQLEEGDEQ
jgi:predicted  nucleic acid-binding Zn-ribbon protein